jgi:hypothetical protein
MSVEGYEAQIKALLENKDSLTKKMTKDGRSEYAVQMNKLKKRMKADGASFKKALNSVKKQEREGTFDRGAEGKRKKNLRAKMAKEPQSVYTKGRHAGSKADKYIKSEKKKLFAAGFPDTSETEIDVARSLSGETDAEREKRKKLKKAHQGRGAK